MNRNFYTRNAADDNLTYRTLSMSIRQKPETVDPENRVVEIVAATDQPVEVFDYERWETVLEVLVIRGAVLPAGRQVPLINSHDRSSTDYVLGSVRALKREDNQRIVGNAHFSFVESANEPWMKVSEGHLRDFSAGYRVLESEFIEAGVTKKYLGVEYTGPLRLTKKWKLKEISVVPIGADELAKSRSDNSNSNKEANAMNKKLRKFLESRGLSVEATEAEAWEFLNTLDSPENIRAEFEGNDPPPNNTGDDLERSQNAFTPVEPQPISAEDAVRAERERIGGIRALCERFDAQELQRGLEDGGSTIEQAKDKILMFVESRMTDEPDISYRGVINMGADSQDKFRNAAIDSLTVRLGFEIATGVELAPGHDELTGYSLVELAREALRMAGQPTHGRRIEMVGRALTTSDLPAIMANVANKSLLRGWATQEETWSVWASTGNFNDFKTHSVVRSSETSDLEEVPEHGAYTYGKLAETKEEYTPATYGRLFSISRQAIINDDVGAIGDIPRKHGQSASRKVGDVVYAVLTANSAMGDGKPLFHADHNNFVPIGTGGGPPQTDTIQRLILNMGTQKDIQGLRRLNIRPVHIIGPKAVEGPAEVFFQTMQWHDTNQAATRTNPYSGTYFNRVWEPRLDDFSATGWYGAAARASEMTVKVYFLDGIMEPFLDTKDGWTVDGIEYKVRLDVVAKALDWRGLFYNAGAPS